MKGKHCKSRTPLSLTPRAAGALVGLAAFGVIAGTAQASIFDADTAGSVAAVETVPHKADTEHEAVSRDEPEAKTDESEPSDSGSGISRDDVISRAETWQPGTDDRVRYSQVRSHEGYRADCSGFVSMTLGLSKPGPNTVGLTSSKYTERIEMSELKKGDLVMDAEGTNTTRHVVIFEKWADEDHTSYWAYEQRGGYGTDYRERSYGLDSGSEFKAYRPKKL